MENGLVSDLPNPTEDQIMGAACDDISYLCNIDDALCCWIGNELQIVFALCADRKAKSASGAKVNVKHLPSSENIKKLRMLLKAEEMPSWYRYDDGTFTPWDGELFLPSGSQSNARKKRKPKSLPKKRRVNLMPVGKCKEKWVEYTPSEGNKKPTS